MTSTANTQMIDVDIRHAVLVRAEPERVWEALTTPDGLNQWFTTGALWTHDVGSPMRWRWVNWGPDGIDAESQGEIIAVEPHRRFVFTWGNGSGERASTVTIMLEPHLTGTKVELTDAGYPDTPPGRHAFMDCACGWGEALTLAKFYVEHGLTY